MRCAYIFFVSACTLFISIIVAPQMRSLWCLGVLFPGAAVALNEVNSSLAQACVPSLPSVLCVDKYASNLPYPFFRASSIGLSNPSFESTTVPNSTSFAMLSKADFLVFDRKRGLEVLGLNASCEFVFKVSDTIHEAPVYVAAQNKLFLSQLEPGFLPQLVVNLNFDPPTLAEFVSDPPVYAPNGGTFYKGLIYWAASGSNGSIDGIEQRSGIRTLDPSTNRSATLLDNYFGYFFNGVDDLAVHPNGDIWFTDPGWSSLYI